MSDDSAPREYQTVATRECIEPSPGRRSIGIDGAVDLGQNPRFTVPMVHEGRIRRNKTQRNESNRLPTG